MLSGAGKLPRRLVFSYVCAGLVPVAPAVGIVLAYLRLVHWWRMVWVDVCVVTSSAACIATLLGGCFLAPRAVMLACVGRLASLVRVCLRWSPAVVSICLCMPSHHVSSYHESAGCGILNHVLLQRHVMVTHGQEITDKRFFPWCQGRVSCFLLAALTAVGFCMLQRDALVRNA